MRAWEGVAAPAVRVWLGGEGAGNGGASSHVCCCRWPYPHYRTVEWNPEEVKSSSVCLCCLPKCVRVLGWALYLGPKLSCLPVATSSSPNPISSLSMAVVTWFGRRVGTVRAAPVRHRVHQTTTVEDGKWSLVGDKHSRRCAGDASEQRMKMTRAGSLE